MSCGSIYSKMHPVSCINTNNDVTDSINHGMVKNTKTWISWERSITFLRNKKFLTLCLRWHILRSHCFVAEVIFNYFWPFFGVLRVCKLYIFSGVTGNLGGSHICIFEGIFDFTLTETSFTTTSYSFNIFSSGL